MKIYKIIAKMSNINLYELISIMKADKELDIRGPEYITRFKQLRNTMREYFKQQVQEYIKQVENMTAFNVNTDIKKYKLKKFNIDERIEAIQNELEKIVVLGQGDIDDLALEALRPEDILGVDTKRAREYARNEGAVLVRRINETTTQKLQHIIDKGLLNNFSLKQIKDEIVAKFNNFQEWRATLIARQETAMAYEKAKADHYRKYKKRYGIQGYKRAITQQDEKVRESHRQNANDGWIKADTRFSGTGDMQAPFGFNCRCVTEYRLRKPFEDEG